MTPLALNLRRAAVGTVLLVVTLLAVGCGRFLGPHERGQRFLDLGDYEAARQVYTEAIEAGDNVSVAYANRCIANGALGENEAAVADCTESLRLAGAEPDDEHYKRWEVLNNRGVAYLGQRKYDEAMADFDSALEMQPEYADAYANRGRAHYEREEYEAAIADLDQAVEHDGELAQAYGNRGLAYEGLGDDELASADYTRAIELSQDPQAYFNRGMLRYTLGQFDDAYEDFRLVVEHSDTDSYLAHMAQVQVDLLENRPTPVP